MLAEATLSSRIVGISDQRWQNLRIPGDKECALTYRTRPVADQLGYGLGVNLDDSTISDLGQRLEFVNILEQALVSTTIN